MRILALDPGPLTGYRYSHYSELCSYGSYGQIEGLNLLWVFLNINKPNLIVCEAFDNRGIKAADLMPVEVIGIVKLWCQINHRELVFQRPADVKSFWTDAKLKKLSVYNVGMPHANDATRHCLHYLTFILKDDKFIQRLK